MISFKLYYEGCEGWTPPLNSRPQNNIINSNPQPNPLGFKGTPGLSWQGGQQPIEVKIPKKRKRKFRRKRRILEDREHCGIELYHPGCWKLTTGDLEGYYKTNVTYEMTRYNRHRLDGPAYNVINARDGAIHEFFINGKEFTEKEYWQHPKVVMYNGIKDTVSSEEMLRLLNTIDI